MPEFIDKRYPLREVGREQGTAAVGDYEFVDGQGDIGVIASVTEPFCSSCTRVRLKAGRKAGHLPLLRNGARLEVLAAERC